MATLQLKHAGIILAGGASSRMGSPKALLKLRDGRTLAEYQADLLIRGGLQDLFLVLGHAHADAAAQLASGHFSLIQNPAWETGRLSSLQAGLKACDADGYLILPVDSVGIHSATIATLLNAAEQRTSQAIRPQVHGKPGRILWIHHNLAGSLIHIPSTPGFRLDDWIRPHEKLIETDDEGILNNINTPEEWQDAQRLLP